MKDNKPTDQHIVQAMEQYGGGFIKALANTWLLADVNNKERLKKAFPDYWEKYAGVASLTHKVL